jgi:hypothetical protein
MDLTGYWKRNLRKDSAMMTIVACPLGVRRVAALSLLAPIPALSIRGTARVQTTGVATA